MTFVGVDTAAFKTARRWVLGGINLKSNFNYYFFFKPLVVPLKNQACRVMSVLMKSEQPKKK